MRSNSPSHAQTLPVFPAAALRVTRGANLGDALSHAEEIEPGDVYELSATARDSALCLLADRLPPFRILAQSAIGTPGADLYLDSCLTFMDDTGATTEVLVLVEVTADGDAAGIYALPLSPLAPRRPYALVTVCRDTPLQRFAQIACVSFTAGTRITLATGAQKPVEELQIGDRVLTRDAGPQPIRWIGRTTLRATGAFAPIRIAAGALNNLNDLRVCPDHRLFIYQRTDELGAGRSELLVRARHLTNGTTIAPEPGGFVDYVQLLFDHHQIVFAEGIAVESMLVDARTSAALPPEMQTALAELIPGHEISSHDGLELEPDLLDRGDMAGLLKRASAG